jgi:hypothetical protein
MIFFLAIVVSRGGKKRLFDIYMPAISLEMVSVFIGGW